MEAKKNIRWKSGVFFFFFFSAGTVEVDVSSFASIS